jgi:S1-C subfamily serine protease
MRSLVAGLLSLAAFLSGCGDSSNSFDRSRLPEPSLENVTITKAYPEVVEVRGKASCTGTFISPRAVLTAAHCISSGVPHSVKMQTGTSLKARLGATLGPGTPEDSRDIAILLVDVPRTAGTIPFYPLGTSVSPGDKVRLVGFGCGAKRTGTNVVFSTGSFIEVLTPSTANFRVGLVGPENRAGSCKGDSGGPMLKEVNGKFQVVGVDHAAGIINGELSTDYIDVTRSDNRDFIKQVNATYELNIEGLN